MAIYDAGTASLSADGTVTGVGTTWRQPLTLIRVGATMIFNTTPASIVTIAEIISDTEIRVFNDKGFTAPAGTQYSILAHDGITVQGLAQDVAETLRYYQSRETEVAAAVDAFNNFDVDTFQQNVTNVSNQSKQVSSDAAQVAADRAQVSSDKDSSALSASSALDSAQRAESAANSIDANNILTKDGNLSGLIDVIQARENLGILSAIDSRPQLRSSSYSNLLQAVTDAVSKGYDLLIDRAENITQPIRLSLSGKDFSIKSTADGWINFTPSDLDTYYQVLTFDGTGTERLVTEVKIDGGKVRGQGRAVVGIASNYVAYHKESSEMRNISAGVNCTGAKLHECIGAYYYNVFQQLASQDWSAGVYGYGCVPIACKTVIISCCTFGTESMPLDRHSVYSSSRDDGTGYNDFVFVSKNNCYMRDYLSESAETTFERCFKFIGTKNVVVDSNVVIGGYGGVLITCRKDQRVNYVGVSNNSFRVFSSGVEVSYQDAAAQDQSTATWSLGTLKVNDNRFDLTTNVSGVSNGIAWRNVDKVYDFNNCYTQLSYPSSVGLAVFYPRTDRIRSSLFISKGSHYSGFNNITREMAPTVTSIELTCQNAVSSQTPLNATGANNQYAFVRSIDGSASWRTYAGSPIPGFRYFDSILDKVIYNSGAGIWNDESGFLSVGPLSSRPNGVPVNFRYWEQDQSRYVVWTGSTWVLSTKSFSPTPLSATTAQIKAIDKAILGYGHVIYDTTAKKPAFFDQLAQAWKYADGTAI